jgi:hypothetical protein
MSLATALLSERAASLARAGGDLADASLQLGFSPRAVICLSAMRPGQSRCPRSVGKPSATSCRYDSLGCSS